MFVFKVKLDRESKESRHAIYECVQSAVKNAVLKACREYEVAMNENRVGDVPSYYAQLNKIEEHSNYIW